MPTPILMPALSPTMEEGTLAKWLVKEGDKVGPGDIIAEIETDKATMEVEAVDEGTIGKILVPEGTEGVKVNAPIAILLEDGEDASALEGYDAGGGASQPPKAAKEEAREPAPAQPESQSQSQSRAAPAQPSARPQPASPAPAAPSTDQGRVIASPLARRIAEHLGVDLTRVQGTGPNGRIVKADVEAAASGGGAPAQAGGAPASAPRSAPAPQPLASGETREIPLNNIRKTIARRLTEAKRDVPHYYLTIDCELDELLRVRSAINSRAPQGEGAWKISVNDFILRACAMALMEVPAVNASFAGDRIIQHGSADIAMAVAMEDGLITPIIFNAEAKGLVQISREAKDLATKAREKKLKPEEYQGGSFSISNLGMFGVKNFTAVINPPHGAILAIGAGDKRPVVKGDKIVPATVMTVTLSCDHRVIDGATGAPFLQAFKGYIEDPALMLL